MADTSGVPVSPVMAGTQPELTISAAPVNNEPVELDGTPTSPDKIRRGSRAQTLEEMSPQEQAKRAQAISERKGNPAILQDIPQTPGADELEKSGATNDEREDSISTSQ